MEKKSGNVVNIRNANGRIPWLDGLKGLACLFVFLSHFTTALYPLLHFGVDVEPHTKDAELMIYKSPVQGEAMVGVFCLCAGLFLCLKVMNSVNSAGKMRSVGLMVVKRYLRLMLPVIPIALFVWASYKLGLFHNIEAAKYTFSPWLEANYDEPLSLTGALSSAVVKTWFYGDDAIATSLWMMYQFFYGSILAIILGTVHWALNKKSVWVYLFTFVVLIPRHDYVCGFALGAVLAYLYVEGYIEKITNRLKKDAFWLAEFVGILLAVFGFVVGGYPKDGPPIGFYEIMESSFYDCYYSVGAFFIILGVWLSGALQRFFNSKVMQFLGKICYELFLLHIPILFSFGMWMWTGLYLGGMNYHMASLVTFIVTTAVIIGVSYLYNRYISKWCGIVIGKVCGWLCQETDH